MPSQPGKRFGRYELVSRLGFGGMAETWRARLLGEESFTKTVLIKKLLPEYADDYAFTTMLISEARISATLTHNNIAQVFDFGRVGSEYFLAMEFVDGQPLHYVNQRALLERFPSVPLPAAVFIGIELCRGLHYAHTRKDESGKPLSIVHRDISPENVIISYEGQVKIVDFGLAKARELRGFNTEPGVMKGKYLFFSPEQARSEEVDARTDVWAAGIVLYEMLCGKLPVEGPEYVVLPRLTKGDFPRPRELKPNVPQELEDIIMDALTIRREDRYPSCQVFADALADYQHSLAPRFSGVTLSYLVQELFRDELTREEREVQVPRSLQEEFASWRKEPWATRPPKSSTATVEAPAAASAAAPADASAAATTENPLPAASPEAPAAAKASRPKWQWYLAVGSAVASVVALVVILILKREPEPAGEDEAAGSPFTRVANAPDRTADYERYIERASTAFSGRRYQVAATSYRLALKLQPSSMEAKEGLGFSLVLGSTDDSSNEEAVKLLQEVLHENALSGRAWFGLGMALHALQEEEEAAEAYRQYLALEPSGRFAPDARLALERLGKN
ncbi:MAG: protein kinase [Myxococcaceae bacterium]|nr:protein kinase [Myxococcaceae bacterium]